MDSAKLVANLRPGRHLADVGQQLLAKTVEPSGGNSVANGPLGLEARERGWSGAMSMTRPIAASPFERRRSMEPDVFTYSCADVCAFTKL